MAAAPRAHREVPGTVQGWVPAWVLLGIASGSSRRRELHCVSPRSWVRCAHLPAVLAAALSS